MTEAEEHEALYKVLEETVEKAPTPVVGINHVLEYLTEYQNQFPADILEQFLIYLSRRDDAIGKEARKRCKAN